MVKKVGYIIIGAGPTGLGAAYQLHKNAITDFKILEKTPHAGGLATSFIDPQGFTWDIGGHVQFSNYAYFNDAMNELLPPDQWLTHTRSAWAWLKERFISYPIQQNLHMLPKIHYESCLHGVPQNPNPTAKAAHFDAWLKAQFGLPLYELFMQPYNLKVWAHPLQDMSYNWITHRIAPAEQKNASWGDNRRFRFPLYGGTGNIWNTLAKQLNDHINYNTTIAQIAPEKHQLTTSDGTLYEYDTLISSMPLDTLCHTLNPQLTSLEAAQDLKYSSTHIIGLGIKGRCPEPLKEKSWMYFSEDNIPFYRATVFSNYSPNHVPKDSEYWSLMLEVSESSHKHVNHKTILQECITAAQNTSLLSDPKTICSKWHYTTQYGYPIPTQDRDAILRQIMPILEVYNIYSRGRFGGWKYEVSNQDHSFMQGVELIDRLLHNIKEATYSITA